MNNCGHIFKELSRMMPELKKKYEPTDIFYIALRLDDKQVPKVEVEFKNLMSTLFHLIDTSEPGIPIKERHPIWVDKHYRMSNLLSIFICDATSTTIYDSRYYRQSRQKYNLKRDKDIRILQFSQLSDEKKENVVDMITAQIQQFQEEFVAGNSDISDEEESSWGEMPWDFQ